MPDLYNLSAVENANGIVDLIVAANNAYPAGAGTGPQILVTGSLIAIFVVFLFLMRKNKFIDSLLVSSFVCFLLSLFLRQAGLVSMLIVVIFSITMGVSAFIKIADTKKSG